MAHRSESASRGHRIITASGRYKVVKITICNYWREAARNDITVPGFISPGALRI
jgi:hypothetical protein